MDFLSRIGGTLSRLQLYEKLTSQPPRLNQILLSIFIKYLRLCLYFRDSLVKEGGHLRPWKNTFKFGSAAFNRTVTEKIQQIDNECIEGHKEAELAVSDAILKNATSSRETLQHLSDVEKARQEAEKLKDLKESKRRFMQWLEELPSEAIHKRIQESQLAGTCEWIEKDELISSWLSIPKPNTSLLWISSGPGSGKSTLAAHVISRLQRRHPTAFFFCRTDDKRTLNTMAVLQNWIWQLVRDSPILPESVTAPSDEYQSPSIVVLEKILLELQQHLKTSFLVVDGLDECVDNKTDFLQTCQTLSKVWNVLIVSRDVPDIRKGLAKKKFNHKMLKTNDNRMDIDRLMMHKVITKKDTQEDIKKIVNKYTEDLAREKSWETVQTRIAEVLNANAEGMFLWVQLVLEFLLEDAIFESDIEDILQNIPSGLNDLYDKILAKLKADPPRWRIAQRALYWVIHGLRPFTVDQIHAAISFEVNSSKPISGFSDLLQASCGLLLRIDDISGKVGIYHATVKEYISRTPDIFAKGIDGAEFAHGQMAKTCVSYLHAKLNSGIHVDGDFQHSEQRIKSHLQSESNALLEYSVIYWCQHISKSIQQSKAWQPDLIQLFSSEDLTCNWLQLFQYLKAGGSRPGTSETVELLRSALDPHLNDTTAKALFDHVKLSSFKGHFGIADGGRFLRWGRFIRNADDVPKLFPIILVAAQFDFVDIVKREIRRRVNIETKSFRGGSTLVWAARANSKKTVQYLLGAGAMKDDQSLFNQETALAKSIYLEDHIAAYPGTYTITQTLLEANADPYLSHRDSWNLLNVLINSHTVDGDGEVSAVRLLLKHGPNLWNHAHQRAGPILHHAVARNKPRIASAIIEELQAQNSESASKLLTQRFHGENALHYALLTNASMVPVLLDLGADGNIPDSEGVLPIQYAAGHDLGSTIDSLRDHKCDIYSKGHWNETPLTIALQSQSIKAASVLLDLGAGVQQIPQSLVLLPRTVPLDDRIAAVKPNNIPWPLSERDILQICYRLRDKYGFTIPVVARMFDMAEIWVQSSVIRNDEQEYDEHTLRNVYIESAPIRGRLRQPVQRVRFTITSHDQGYSTVEGSHTWFEVGQASKGASTKAINWPLVHNRAANWEWKTHQITWNTSDREVLRLFRPEDRISVVARAEFPAWVNYVKDIRIDVYTSILRRHYIESELADLYAQLETTPESKIQKAKLQNIIIHPPKRSELRILSADYGTRDVTPILSDLVIDNRFLQLNTNGLDIHFTDTFRGTGKALTFIYQVDDSDPVVFLTTQNRGPLIVDLTTMGWKTAEFPKPADAAIHILAVFYGDRLIKKENVYREIYRVKAEGGEILVNNKNFVDTWHGNRKACVVYFREADGSIGRKAAKEGERLRF